MTSGTLAIVSRAISSTGAWCSGAERRVLRAGWIRRRARRRRRAVIAPATPYFGFDVARGITYRNIPPRLAAVENGSAVTVSASGVVVLSVTIHAPDDGALLTAMTTEMFCSGSAAGDARASLFTNLDSTSSPPGFGYLRAIPDCTVSTNLQSRILTLTHTFAVGAGPHTVNFVASDAGGVNDLVFDDNTLTALFVDQGATGATAPRGPANPLFDGVGGQ